MYKIVGYTLTPLGAAHAATAVKQTTFPFQSQFLRKAAPGSTGMNAESDTLQEKMFRSITYLRPLKK